MNISCIQIDVKLNDANRNFDHAKVLIKKAAEDKPDVIVLPETWNVGFAPKETDQKECDDNGKRVKTEIGALAKELKINIVAGSVANIKNGKLYNTSYVFDRLGSLVCEYDKTHLFTPMGEQNYFEKGDTAVSFELDGHSCTLVICYDIRFPELVRKITAEKQTDYLFMVSQWPAVRVFHLKTLLTARAIENQMFAVCCNCPSDIAGTKFGGNSMIINPWGEMLAEAGDSEETVTAECDESILADIRNSINVFADRRADLYNK